MSRFKSYEVECDYCGCREWDVSAKHLIPQLRKSGWKIGMKDVCNTCHSQHKKGKWCKKHDHAFTIAYDGNDFCATCDYERVYGKPLKQNGE